MTFRTRVGERELAEIEERQRKIEQKIDDWVVTAENIRNEPLSPEELKEVLVDSSCPVEFYVESARCAEDVAVGSLIGRPVFRPKLYRIEFTRSSTGERLSESVVSGPLILDLENLESGLYELFIEEISDDD